MQLVYISALQPKHLASAELAPRGKENGESIPFGTGIHGRFYLFDGCYWSLLRAFVRCALDSAGGFSDQLIDDSRIADRRKKAVRTGSSRRMSAMQVRMPMANLSRGQLGERNVTQ
jgi:hypothetical protein